MLKFQRILGHKAEYPGSGQWVEISTQTTPAENITDWIQSKSILTYIFWSKSLAWKSQREQLYSKHEIQKLASFLKHPDPESIKKQMASLKNR